MPTPFSSLTRRLRAVAVAGGVIYTLVAVFWAEGPFALTFDDAYYYFEIARRIADGQGSTFDGIAETNGYHPLWMAICTIPYMVGIDGIAAVRLLLELQVVLWVVALWILAGLIGDLARDRARVRTVAGGDDDTHRSDAGGSATEWLVTAVFALITLNPFVVRIGVSGLESILVVLLGAVLLRRACAGPGTLIAERDRTWLATTATVLAAAFLARTDSAFLVGTMGFAACAEVRRRHLGRSGWVGVALLTGPTVAVAAAYLAWNIARFGGPQISGVVKRAPLSFDTVAPFLVVIVVLAVCLVRSGRRLDRITSGSLPRLLRTSTFTATTGWYGAFALVTIAYYSFLQVQQWLWYYAPALVWAVALAGVTTTDIAERTVSDAKPQTSAPRALAPLGAMLALPLLLLAVTQVRTFIDPHIRSIQLANRDAGEWISANLPPDAVLASWDAGVVAYFADQSIVNLDGVVNGYEWFEATEDGPVAVARYLDGAGVGYIVNHGLPLAGEDPDIRPFVEELWGPARSDGAEVAHTVPFTYSGTTVGSGGRSSGTRDLAVFVYRLPDR